MATEQQLAEQVKKSFNVIANVREVLKSDSAYPEGTSDRQMSTLLEQIDAIIYAAEKLKEINDFIDDTFVQEVKDFFDN